MDLSQDILIAIVRSTPSLIVNNIVARIPCPKNDKQQVRASFGPHLLLSYWWSYYVAGCARFASWSTFTRSTSLLSAPQSLIPPNLAGTQQESLTQALPGQRFPLPYPACCISRRIGPAIEREYGLNPLSLDCDHHCFAEGIHAPVLLGESVRFCVHYGFQIAPASQPPFAP